MKRLTMRHAMVLIVMTLGAGSVALAATDLPLPVPVLEALERARAPSDIAAIAAGRPKLAATIMAEAAVLGIAAPSAVVADLVRPVRDCEDLRLWVLSAAEAAPLEADIVAAVAFRAMQIKPADCALKIIAAAAIEGIETSDLTQNEVASEAVEIASALGALMPDRKADIAAAIVAATDTEDDDPEKLLAAFAVGIETADIARRRRNGRPARSDQRRSDATATRERPARMRRGVRPPSSRRNRASPN